MRAAQKSLAKSYIRHRHTSKDRLQRSTISPTRPSFRRNV